MIAGWAAIQNIECQCAWQHTALSVATASTKIKNNIINKWLVLESGHL